VKLQHSRERKEGERWSEARGRSEEVSEKSEEGIWNEDGRRCQGRKRNKEECTREQKRNPERREKGIRLGDEEGNEMERSRR
jgi:hypothetical protein